MHRMSVLFWWALYGKYVNPVVSRFGLAKVLTICPDWPMLHCFSLAHCLMSVGEEGGG